MKIHIDANQKQPHIFSNETKNLGLSHFDHFYKSTVKLYQTPAPFSE